MTRINRLRYLKWKNRAASVILKVGTGIDYLAYAAHIMHCDKLASKLLLFGFRKFQAPASKMSDDVSKELDDILFEMIKEGIDVRITN